MLLTFFRYLRAKLPRDKVLEPWIDQMQAPKATGKHKGSRSSTAENAADSEPPRPDNDQ